MAAINDGYASMDGDAADRKQEIKRLQGALVFAGVVIVGLVVGLVVAVKHSDAAGGGGTPATPGDEISFFHVTDVHLDPHYDPAVSCTHFCRNTGLSQTMTVCGPTTLKDALTAAPYGRFGCDAPPLLFDSATAHMKSVDAAPAFILVSGDLAAHHLCGNATYLTPCGSPLGGHLEAVRAIQMVVASLRKQFPDAPIVSLYGNNDVPNHYVTPLGSLGKEWRDEMLDIWKPAAMCADCKSASAKLPESAGDWSMWETTGAYSVRVGPSPGFRVIALNTLLFGTLERYNLTQSGGMADQKAAAEAMMTWFEATLADADTAGERVIISSHMPPGMQPYSDSAVWDAPWVARYMDAVAKHAKAVAGQLYGHFHYDTFRVLGDAPASAADAAVADAAAARAPPGAGARAGVRGLTSGPESGFATAGVPRAGAVLMAPSISPVNRNNPAFRRMLINKTGMVVSDYEQYWLDLARSNAPAATTAKAAATPAAAGATGPPAWSLQYKFSTQYGRDATPANLADLANAMLTNTLLYSDYQRHRQVLYSPFRHHYQCAMTRMNATQYAACRAEAQALEMFEKCQPAT